MNPALFSFLIGMALTFAVAAFFVRRLFTDRDMWDQGMSMTALVISLALGTLGSCLLAVGIIIGENAR